MNGVDNSDATSCESSFDRRAAPEVNTIFFQKVITGGRTLQTLVDLTYNVMARLTPIIL